MAFYIRVIGTKGSDDLNSTEPLEDLLAADYKRSFSKFIYFTFCCRLVLPYILRVNKTFQIIIIVSNFTKMFSK